MYNPVGRMSAVVPLGETLGLGATSGLHGYLFAAIVGLSLRAGNFGDDAQGALRTAFAVARRFDDRNRVH